jgi:hypothetical protein
VSEPRRRTKVEVYFIEAGTDPLVARVHSSMSGARLMGDFRNRFHVRARFLRSSAIEDAEVLCECPLPTQNDKNVSLKRLA